LEAVMTVDVLIARGKYHGFSPVRAHIYIESSPSQKHALCPPRNESCCTEAHCVPAIKTAEKTHATWQPTAGSM